MEILVLSDSHGRVDHMVRAVEQDLGPVSLLVNNA